jgi:alcohol dehydrogenase
MKIRSAILRRAGAAKPYAQSQPIEISNVELSAPVKDEVLVKIAAAGVCHSDLSAINGDRPRPLPVALGHEASGIVEEIGRGVTSVARGDHLVMSFLPICGECAACAEGRASLCGPGYAANAAGTLLSGQRHIVCEGVSINHHSGVSAFSEYAVVSRKSVIKIDPEFDLVHAALFGCAVVTGVGAVINTCHVRPGESVVVVGLGGVGLASVLGAAAVGAEPIVAVDMIKSKLDLALQLGATHAFLASDPDIIAKVKDVTHGGALHALEMAGSAKAFELAFKLTGRGGTTATAGLANVNSHFEISPLALVGEERTIKGSYMGSAVPSRDIPRYISLFKAGRLPVDKLLSRTGPLDEINDAFDRLDRAEVIRQVILPHGRL